MNREHKTVPFFGATITLWYLCYFPRNWESKGISYDRSVAKVVCLLHYICSVTKHCFTCFVLLTEENGGKRFLGRIFSSRKQCTQSLWVQWINDSDLKWLHISKVSAYHCQERILGVSESTTRYSTNIEGSLDLHLPVRVHPWITLQQIKKPQKTQQSLSESPCFCLSCRQGMQKETNKVKSH